MRCPKCQFDHELQTTECLKCGIVFSRYQAALEQAAKRDEGMKAISSGAEAQGLQGLTVGANAPSLTAIHEEMPIGRNDAMRELICRAAAVPAALLLAWLVTGTGLRLIAAMLAMVLHESGHAMTAWLTGRWAVPLLWVTPHGEERSWGIVLIVTAGIVIGGFLAWRAERWGWVCAAGGALLLQLTVLSLPAGQLIVFFGDGGALVFATILMAAFYAPRESAVARSWGLRWGLLAIGALSFMHVFRTWTGPIEDIPFGEIEGVNLSDPSLLTEMYGWPVPQLIERYVTFGTACLVVLAGLYVGGLVFGYLEVRYKGWLGERKRLA